MDKIVLAWVRTTLQRTTEETAVVVEYDREVPLDIVLKDIKRSMCDLQSKCFLVMTGLRYFWMW